MTLCKNMQITSNAQFVNYEVDLYACCGAVGEDRLGPCRRVGEVVADPVRPPGRHAIGQAEAEAARQADP